MTIDEVKNTPEIVDLMLDESVTADARIKLHKRLDELCKLAIEAINQQTSKEDALKFYYVESLNDYWIGKRLDTMYYAEWNSKLQAFVWKYSKYLPWGEHVVAPNTLWKEYTYPSEPKEISFAEWIKGFLKKYGRNDIYDK